MPRLAWFKFYPGDWRNDEQLRMCSIAARGLWHEMMCIMAQAERFGELRVGKRVVTPLNLSRLAGLTPDETEALLAELDEWDIYSVDAEGCIYSRRMVRDGEARKKAREYGKRGGNPQLVKLKDKDKAKLADKRGVNPPSQKGLKLESESESESEKPELPRVRVRGGSGRCREGAAAEEGAEEDGAGGGSDADREPAPGGSDLDGAGVADLADQLAKVCARTGFGREDLRRLELRLAAGQTPEELIEGARLLRRRGKWTTSKPGDRIDRPLVYLDVGAWLAMEGFSAFKAAWPAEHWEDTPGAVEAWVDLADERQEDQEAFLEKVGPHPAGDPPSVILAGVARWKASDRWRRGIVKPPAKWIRARNWQDPAPSGKAEASSADGRSYEDY